MSSNDPTMPGSIRVAQNNICFALGNKPFNNFIKILCAGVALALVVIAITVYKADVAQLAIYVGFAVIYVQIPGLCLLRLGRIKLDHISTTICAGFFAGWAFVVLQYFICELINNDLILYALGPMATIAYICIAVRKPGAGGLSGSDTASGSSMPRQSESRVLGQPATSAAHSECGITANSNRSSRTVRSRRHSHVLPRICDNKFHISRLSTAFCIFATLILAYALLSTQFLHINPEYSASTYMNPDKAYHMGLIDSLSHGWPLESPWAQGRIIKYHIFTELLLAIPVRLFGVSADVAIFSFNPILTTYSLGLSTYVMFREFVSQKQRAGLYSLSIMLSNMFLVRSAHTSMAFHFAIINDNAVGYGISCIMFAFVLLKYWYNRYSEVTGAGFKSGVFAGNYLILLFFITMLLTGIKGPMGIVFVAAIWGTYVIGLILRKVPFKTCIPILILSIAFIFIYMTIMSGKGASNGSGESIFAMATIANIAFFRAPLVAFMQSLGIPKIIRLAVMLVVFMIFMLTAYIVPFTAGYIRELYLVFSKKKDFDFARVVIYAAFLVGLMAMLLLNYSGHSQVYFGLVSVFVTPLIAFWFFEDIEAKANRKALSNVIAGIFIGSLLVCTCTLAISFDHMIGSAKYSSNPNNEYSKYLSISNSEYEAMEWIDKNTPKDSLLATDRYYSVDLSEYSYEDRWANRFFLYATYSNRFCYIAGSGYNFPAAEWQTRKDMILTNAKLYDPDNKERAELARELGVDYVVVSKRFTYIPSLEGSGYSLCFSNSDIDIYEIEQ